MANCMDQCGQAYDVGFDSLNFAEHHYSPKQLTPNPIVYAGVCGRRYPGANIGVFGTDLPLNNPVRIAEEYSMLDNMLGGNRLRFGLLRGRPMSTSPTGQTRGSHALVSTKRRCS
jgi:alkanesulfonate monooxygenase SsuD/methylene tetrahydromethanopterin reductase-like flavin-dependent oxidoreductase (luciferase family)